ncbi:hypothetical protein SEA_JENOS_1 [Microbacterium phage Jenos]|uniref:Uncharacterized protein n=1 Tax=Microbacterium phage McGalleon TaxID=2590936 RepID=A0A516KR39_9CAUD|nr:hypothetical protein H3N88_gp01 [Microbacterium phage McGalleon]QDP44115.1 hypothetical protein SEA_MCGALLEON_1 [Microbacterium phage McGalleon]QXO14471.1 hypothetical protein SEA_JENOS_1 [Microbacterium phage Jenos]
MCKSHGGGTAASLRASRRASAGAQAATLWGISSEAGSVSIVEELNKLARNKLTDILALRLELGIDPDKHIGTLLETSVVVEYDIEGTVQSKSGTQKTRSRRSGVSPWVQELHKAEMELLQIFRLLHEIQGGTDEVDTKRLRIQTARETARLLKAFPGLPVDEVVAEVAKSA